MNVQEMIDAIHEETGIKKVDVMSVLKVQGDIAQSAINGGEDVMLHGIGKLKPVQKAARTGRNPATGEEIEIPAKTAVKFAAAKALRDAVAE